MKRLEDKQKNVDARHALLALSDIEPNLGQLEGLPSNPRDITKEKVEMLKQSVLLNPEMLYLRGLMITVATLSVGETCVIVHCLKLPN